MATRVGVAKAAQMLGISRAELQQLIRSGDLPTFEGQVDFDDLCERFPVLEFNKSPMIERVQIIKDAAFGERVQQHVVPEVDDLEIQIRRLNINLNIERGKSRKYQTLIEDLLKIIPELTKESEKGEGKLLLELNQWLLTRFKK